VVHKFIEHEMTYTDQVFDEMTSIWDEMLFNLELSKCLLQLLAMGVGYIGNEKTILWMDLKADELPSKVSHSKLSDKCLKFALCLGVYLMDVGYKRAYCSIRHWNLCIWRYILMCCASSIGELSRLLQFIQKFSEISMHLFPMIAGVLVVISQENPEGKGFILQALRWCFSLQLSMTTQMQWLDSDNLTECGVVGAVSASCGFE